MGIRLGAPLFECVEKMPNGCWEWQGHRDDDGYGRRKSGGVRVQCHRLAWEEARGPIPDRLQVLHHCDNPPCINPDHLFLGTNADNMRDRSVKERGWSTKITASKVEDIRRRYAAGGVTQEILGDEFGLEKSTISRIVAHKRWKHVA